MLPVAKHCSRFLVPLIKLGRKREEKTSKEKLCTSISLLNFQMLRVNCIRSSRFDFSFDFNIEYPMKSIFIREFYYRECMQTRILQIIYCKCIENNFFSIHWYLIKNLSTKLFFIIKLQSVGENSLEENQKYIECTCNSLIESFRKIIFAWKLKKIKYPMKDIEKKKSTPKNYQTSRFDREECNTREEKFIFTKTTTMKITR